MMHRAMTAGRPAGAGPLRTPVLLLVFNRPETTARVIAAIRAARPARFYVAADGPRNAGEAERCEAARRVATQVDWPCDLHTLFRERNLGCRRAVGDAISWFFSREESGIVLEDDCVPSASFFGYCEELLDRYRDDERVMSIGGSNFQKGRRRGPASYYATKHFHCWGWASWRRAWAEYDGELSSVGATLEKGLAQLQDGSAAFKRYWMRIYRDCRAGRYSSWAYPMSLTCFARVGAGRESLHLAPQVNLVANIGFGGGGTHISVDNQNPAATAGELALPLRHPERLVRDVDADCFTDKTHFRIGWAPLLKEKLMRMLPL